MALSHLAAAGSTTDTVTAPDVGGERLDGIDHGFAPDRVEQVEVVLTAGQLGVDDVAA